jgi:hypothetical protein
MKAEELEQRRKVIEEKKKVSCPNNVADVTSYSKQRNLSYFRR